MPGAHTVGGREQEARGGECLHLEERPQLRELWEARSCRDGITEFHNPSLAIVRGLRRHPRGSSAGKHPQTQDRNPNLCPQVATCPGHSWAARSSLPASLQPLSSLPSQLPPTPRPPRPIASGWGRASFHLLRIFISSTSYNCTFQNRILRAEKPRAFGVFSLRSREKQTLIPV